MRRSVVWQLAMVSIFMAGCTEKPATKTSDAKPSLLHLKVDFAAPSGKDDPKPIAGTTKDGWWHWVIPDWDFYRSDLKWEDGKGRYPEGGPGIAGSGVHAAITCHYEGIMTIYVAGMRRYLAGGIQPEKKPMHEPLCNTWVAGSDFPNNPTSDVLLSFYDIPAGKYRLVSYHNSFNCRRIGDDPTGVECSETREPEPPMASIKVYPLKTVLTEYFGRRTDALVKGSTYGTSEDKIIVPGKQGTGDVKQTLEAKNVVIQQVTADAELKASIIEFTTDGSPLVVVYAGGCCKSDDLRCHRKGGYAVLNAFELIQLPAETNTRPARSSIPYVATRSDTVRDMLWMANVGKDDVVYDLGSGDGRIVIAAVRDFGTRRAVGIEIDPKRIRESRKNAQKAGVKERVEFIQGDLFTTDFREASVVALFLGHRPNIKLRPRILSILKPGSRIVSHQFNMGEWQPDKTMTIRTVFWGMYGTMWNRYRDNPQVPDYAANELHPDEGDRIFMWVVPAPVAGVWRGKIKTAQGLQDCKLMLHQRLSKVTGTFQLSGQKNLAGGVHVDLWGNHVRYWCRPDHRSHGLFEMRFDGHVQGNTMRGTVAVTEHGKVEEHAWQAQRGTVDFTGTWEWPCASGSRSVRLRIERRGGHLIATYLDGDQTIPVTDFYDFGGGFYFTLLIGREGDTLKITQDTGWLIGEGILQHGELKGTVEFYPYQTSHIPGMSGERKSSRTVIQNWAPRLIKP